MLQFILFDEAWCLSSELWDAAVQLHRLVLPFNPRQRMIGIGDHNQLSPVEGQTLDKGAEFANCAIVYLTQNMRQVGDDCALARLISDMSTGEKVNNSTIDTIRSIANSPAPSDDDIAVYAAVTNDCVAENNNRMLNKLPETAEERTYTARDTGDLSLLKDIMPDTVTVKEGASLMLTANVDVARSLVNGRMGRAKKLHDNAVTMALSGGEEIKVEYLKRSVTDWVTGEELATRQQIPLALSFALTVHKLQGGTVTERIHVDLRKISCFSKKASTQRALIYVALSRAISRELVSLQLSPPMMKSEASLRKILDAGLEERRKLTAILRERSDRFFSAP